MGQTPDPAGEGPRAEAAVAAGAAGSAARGTGGGVLEAGQARIVVFQLHALRIAAPVLPSNEDKPLFGFDLLRKFASSQQTVIRLPLSV